MNDGLSSHEKRLCLISILMSVHQTEHVPALSLEMFDLAEKLSGLWGFDMSEAAEVVSAAIEG